MPGLMAISAGISIASSVLGFSSRRSARKKQKRADALNASRSKIANIQARRAAMAAVRRQQAQQTVAAIAGGMAGGSADFATASSIQSQGLAVEGRQRAGEALGGQVHAREGSANRYSHKIGRAHR